MTIPGNASATRYLKNFQDDSIKCRGELCVTCPDWFECGSYGEFEDDYSYNCEKECEDCNYNCSGRGGK